MSLLYTLPAINKTIKLILLGIIFFLLQLYSPLFYFYDKNISPDFMLVFMILIAPQNNRRYMTISGFLIGLSQDILAHQDIFGFMALIKTCFGFFLGTIDLKSQSLKSTYLLFLFIVIHFFTYNIITYFGILNSSIFYIISIILQSLLTLFSVFVYRYFLGKRINFG